LPPETYIVGGRETDANRFEAAVTAREARALGVQWVFAPVSDVNNNPDNPVINIRSFGEDPEEVSKHVAAFIEGAHSDPNNRVMLSAKHFPGHGDTNVDSHYGLPRLEASRERIEALELKPFETTVSHGVDNIINEQMCRGGSTVEFKAGQGSVGALQAGADGLLMPPNPELAIRAVVAAVENGRLKRERVEESVMRVLAAKVRVGLTKKKLVDVDQVSDVLDSPDEDQRVQQISDRAVTLARNEANVLPLAAANPACFVIVTASRISQYGQRLMAEVRKRAPNARAAFVDSSTSAAALADVVSDNSNCPVVVAAVFNTGVPLNGQIALFLEKLTAGAAPVVAVAVGSPYVLSALQKSAAAVATFSATVPSEVAAVKALFGEMSITGHLPVTIPGVGSYGDGIQLAARGR
jgi:beta-N-acetylhexosaminidase